MSYGDDNKWGGCIEIYGGVLVQILDIKLGCHYLPVDTDEVKYKVKLETDGTQIMKQCLS